MQRQVARVATHGLKHHDAIVTNTGGAQVFDGFGHRAHRRVKNPRAIGAGHVVVDGLGDSHHLPVPRRALSPIMAMLPSPPMATRASKPIST